MRHDIPTQTWVFPKNTASGSLLNNLASSSPNGNSPCPHQGPKGPPSCAPSKSAHSAQKIPIRTRKLLPSLTTNVEPCNALLRHLVRGPCSRSVLVWARTVFGLWDLLAASVLVGVCIWEACMKPAVGIASRVLQRYVLRRPALVFSIP